MLSKIPGFRSNVLWKKIVGSLIYVFLVLFVLVSASEQPTSLDKIMAVIQMLFLFSFVAFPALYWRSENKFFPWIRKTRNARILSTIGYAIVGLAVFSMLISIKSPELKAKEEQNAIIAQAKAVAGEAQKAKDAAAAKAKSDAVAKKAADDKAKADEEDKKKAEADAKAKTDADAKVKAESDAAAKANVVVSTNTKTSETNQAVSNNTVQSPPAPSNNEPITSGGGLGDSVDIINRIYGEPTRINQPLNQDGYGFLVYKNDLYLILFMNKLAYNFTIQYEALGSEHHVSRAQAEIDAKRIIPKDAVKVREYKKDNNLDVAVYTSKLLTPKFTNDEFKNSDGNVEPGTFDVMYGHDDKGLIFNIVVAPGDMP